MRKIIFINIFIISLLFLPVRAEEITTSVNESSDDFEIVEPLPTNSEEYNEDENDEDIDYDDFLNFEETDENNKDEITLDTPSNSKNNSQKKTEIKAAKIQVNKAKDDTDFSQILNSYDNPNIYDKKSASFSKEKSIGNFSFGSSYDSSITPNNLSQTRTLFTKYQKDKVSLKTSYQNNTFGSFGQQFNGTFSLSPEYKLNNHISLQSVYSRNILDKSNKNELVFSLKPFNDDRMNLNVGASQINYDNGAPTRSQLNFSTKINF